MEKGHWPLLVPERRKTGAGAPQPHFSIGGREKGEQGKETPGTEIAVIYTFKRGGEGRVRKNLKRGKKEERGSSLIRGREKRDTTPMRYYCNRYLQIWKRGL